MGRSSFRGRLAAAGAAALMLAMAFATTVLAGWRLP